MRIVTVTATATPESLDRVIAHSYDQLAARVRDLGPEWVHQPDLVRQTILVLNSAELIVNLTCHAHETHRPRS